MSNEQIKEKSECQMIISSDEKLKEALTILLSAQYYSEEINDIMSLRSKILKKYNLRQQYVFKGDQ